MPFSPLSPPPQERSPFLVWASEKGEERNPLYDGSRSGISPREAWLGGRWGFSFLLPFSVDGGRTAAGAAQWAVPHSES